MLASVAESKFEIYYSIHLVGQAHRKFIRF